MMKVGDRVPLELGGEAEITQLLGQGGQGAVYRASYRGRDYALKMYFTKKLKNPAMFRENLQHLCEDGSSSPAFVMPLMMTADTSEGFGFLMELIPPEYAPFSDILNARVKFSGLYSIVNAAIKITSAFRQKLPGPQRRRILHSPDRRRRTDMRLRQHRALRREPRNRRQARLHGAGDSKGRESSRQAD